MIKLQKENAQMKSLESTIAAKVRDAALTLTVVLAGVLFGMAAAPSQATAASSTMFHLGCAAQHECGPGSSRCCSTATSQCSTTCPIIIY
jgi:hypothetical protein